MKIGILGSGDVAKALAGGFLGRGDSVMLGTRDPAKLGAWQTSAGGAGSIGTFAEAAAFGELVLVATNGAAAVDAVTQAGSAHFAGKVVIDVTNPLVLRENAPPGVFVGGDDSLGERVQRALPGARVVKAFNTVNCLDMVHPDYPEGPPDFFLCGDDTVAKAEVGEIARSFGWRSIVDLGPLEVARYLEPMVNVWVLYGAATGKWRHAFRMLTK
jgi:predicted dinucleotide-binding enzyme